MTAETLPTDTITIVKHDEISSRMREWSAFVAAQNPHPSLDPRWMEVLRIGLKHRPICLEAISDGKTVGLLPLCFVESWLFGRFLVGLPYLNRGGVTAASPAVATCLVDRAVELADKLRVKFLELRHEQPVEHPALGATLTSKVHMQLELPTTSEQLWTDLDAKVRNQIRKGQKQEFQIRWGTVELLNDFYHIFSRNMRDLGTPVYSRKLFEAILNQFTSEAELCVIYKDNKPAAAGLLVHGIQCTEVPSASALREYNSLNANMFMYWQLLERAVLRQQSVFDFGRSSIDSTTFRFKKQWGATPKAATWQYYLRQGDKDQMRPSNKKFELMSRVWRKLPLSVTRLLGPAIVRGVP